ncbi:MAG: hypothetical protein KME64_22125 [Scytonematopsis contorta HA4267-MV1]|jgi:uncharacterized membrane protein (DUF485 family)|nr:hypothetical protein [Scytonematopsis contorta HA4267-MV1]
MNFNCPHCQQTDLVQRVSAIYNSGHESENNNTSDLDSDGSWINTKNTSISISVKIQLNEDGKAYLQQKFVPPKKPKVPTEEYLKYTVVLAVVPFAFIMMSGHRMGWMAYMIFPGFPLAALILFIAYLCRWLCEFIFLRKPRRSYQQRFNIWRRNSRIWGRLHYCHRCDIVYDPEQAGLVSSVHNLKKFYK